MNEKEEFEDIIASKFSEAEFPFDEANWDNAEEMISSFRKKEKRRRFGFVFFSGIVLGIIVMLPFVIKLNEKPSNPIVEVINPSNENSNTQPLNTGTQPENKTKEINEGEPNAVTKEIAEVIKKEKSNDLLIDRSSTNIEQKIAEEPALTGHLSGNKIRKNRTYAGQLVSHNSGIRMKQRKLKFQPVLTTHLPASITAAEPNKQELSLLEKLDNTIIPEKDSIQTVALLSDPENIVNKNKSSLMHPWTFSAAMGGNYVNSFSFNPIQGIEISKSISSHFEIGTGVYYTYLTINSGAVKTIITHSNFDFGYQKDVTEIKTNKLHYAVIPVFAKFNLNDKNSFIMGANMFALFTSSNSVTTYKEVYGEKQASVTKKTSGYSNGINTYDVGLLFGYKRQLFGNLGAAIYFNYGLMDIKKNDYYNENKFERNISGQFMLTYKL